jgi:hypothetical protein
MCERRELCTDGTKQQLVEALMQWVSSLTCEVNMVLRFEVVDRNP